MIRTVLFDLDGTTVNTNELIIASFLHTMEGVAPEPFSRERLISHFGEPLIDQLKLFSGREEVGDLLLKYRSYNLARHDELVMEFPHVRDTMAKLREAGIRIGIVTSKIRKTTAMGLERFGLAPHVEAVITVEDVKEPKPDPEGILKAIEILGGEISSTVMVGDSQYDILAAKNAGVKSAGVSWTLKGEDFLKQFEPDIMLQDMRELLAFCGV